MNHKNGFDCRLRLRLARSLFELYIQWVYVVFLVERNILLKYVQRRQVFMTTNNIQRSNNNKYHLTESISHYTYLAALISSTATTTHGFSV